MVGKLHPTSRPLRICICGGGNAAHVLLAILGTRQDVEVKLWDLYQPEIPKFQAAFKETDSTIVCEHNDEKPDTRGKVAAVSSDPADVVPGSDLVLIAVPAFAHAGYLKGMVPFVEANTVVGCMVAEGGFDYALRDAFGERYHDMTCFAMETLPWACRIADYGKKARILGIKREVSVAISPKADAADVLAFLNGFIALPWEGKATPYPNFIANGGYIVATLNNINAWFHPAVMYGQWRGHENDEMDEPPPFYQGVGDLAEDTLARFSDELMAIKGALIKAKPELDLESVLPIKDFFFNAYSGDIGDESTLGSAMRTNKGYQGLKHTVKPAPSGSGKFVGDWNARYFTEDIPFGLVPVKGIAEVLDIPTPGIDEVIAWCQGLMGKEYIVKGRLVGKDLAECRCPQASGWHTLEHAFV